MVWLFPTPLAGSTLAGSAVAVAGMGVLGSALGLMAFWLARRLSRPAEVFPYTVALSVLVLLPHLLQVADHTRWWAPGVALFLWAVVRWRLALGLVFFLSLAVVPRGLLQPQTVGDGPSQAVGGLVLSADTPDVLLITVDTLRADALFQPPDAPQWLRFDQAISASPWTLPAFISLFSGLPVARHGGGLPLGDEVYTRPRADVGWLPERFAQAGYDCQAFVSNPYLRKDWGFARGFRVFVHADGFVEPHWLWHNIQAWRLRLSGRVQRVRHQRDERLVRAAVGAWRVCTAPRFFWLHLLAPHEYARDPQTPVVGWEPGTQDMDVLRRSYAANVHASEVRLASVLASVDLEQTLVAVVADHGEAFGEPGYRGHGRGLSDPELRVPMWLRGPGVDPGVIARQVTTADLGHTLSGLAHLGQSFAGQDARTAIRQRVAVGGLRRDASRFGYRLEGGGVDRVETPAPPLGVGQAVSQEAREQLRLLGYVDP